MSASESAAGEVSTLGGAVAKFSAWLYRRPAGLPAEHVRFYALGRIGYPLGAAIHVAFLLAFWYLDIVPLVAFNLFSLLIFGIAIWRHARGDLPLPYALAMVEIAAHAVLATAYVGFNAVFGIYLLIMLVATLLVPFLERRWRFVIAGALGLAVIGLGIFGIQAEPLVAVPAVWQIAFFGFNIVAFSIALAAMVAAYEWAAAVAEAALQKEYDRAEMLLENILPNEIAERLKLNPGVIADEFSDVTVLFADIVDFTAMAERLTPAQVIAILNAVFSDFDDLVDRYGLEKIKTIGDAYMVVAGLPRPRPDHARVMADLALDMLRVVGRHGWPDGTPLGIRIGMNSGPVVAGVIGHRKFAYDLWGDAVNVAARMEAHGRTGRIQLTEQCRALIAADFDCSEGQEIAVKSKGTMRTFFLDGRRSGAARPEQGDGGAPVTDPSPSPSPAP